MMKPSMSTTPFARPLADFFLVAVLCVSTCSATTPNTPPSRTFEVPPTWSSVTTEAKHSDTQKWWLDFNDNTLNQLVDRAFVSNFDLKAAAARLAQARALTDGAEAEKRPTLDGAAAAQRGRVNGLAPKIERTSLELRAGWELDVFGRLSGAIDAAQADAEGAAMALQAARIALVADICSAYFELRTLDRRLEVRNQSQELSTKQINIARRKFEAGSASALDVERWQAEQARDIASMAQLEGERSKLLNQLAVLLGESKAPHIPPSTSFVLALTPPGMVLPGILLEHRPDVQQRSRALDAALSRVGVARRDLYPRLQIAWGGAKERFSIANESVAPKFSMGYGISISLPILDGGRIKANIAVQDARAKEAMAEYEKSILMALSEVETALMKWQASESSFVESQRAQLATEKSAFHAQRLYEAGLLDLAAVLDTQRAHMQSREALAEADGFRLRAAVDLRRAFAGAVSSD